jgi:hypothetical protein
VEGTEKVKNTIANNMLNKILAECVWINIHNLPHSELIIEVKTDIDYFSIVQSGRRVWNEMDY